MADLPEADATTTADAAQTSTRSLAPAPFDVALTALLGPVIVLALATGARPSDRLLCIVAAIVVVLPLLWRTRAPIVVLTIVGGTAFAVMSFIDGARVPNIEYLWLPTLIALGAVAARRRLWMSAVALGCSYVAVTTAVFFSFPATDAGWTLTVSALLCGIAWILGVSAHAIRSRIERIEAERERSQTALRVERGVIASGIEAVIQQAVRRMRSDADAARRTIADDAVATTAALERIEADGVTAMQELRRVVRRLDVEAEPGRRERGESQPQTDHGAVRRRLLAVSRSDLVIVVLVIVATVAFTTFLGGGLTVAVLVFAPVLVTLLWRHQFPVLVFLLIAAAYAIVVVLYHGGDFAWDSWIPVIGLLTALAAVAGTTPIWLSIPIALAAWAYVSLAALVYPAVLVENVATYGLLVATVWLVGYFGGRRRRRLAQLQRDRDADALRVERQHAQLAHDLHDLIGHSITVMVLQAAGARRILPQNRERAASALDVIDAAGNDALRELDQLVTLLRSAAGSPSGVAAPRASGLADLPELVERARVGVREIVLRTHGTASTLSAERGAAAYEVVRDAIANAEKHAGGDTRITIDTTWGTGGVRIVVVNTRDADDPDPEHRLSGGYGLQSLRQRVQAVGGELTWDAGSEHFRLEAQIPVAHPESVGTVPDRADYGT